VRRDELGVLRGEGGLLAGEAAQGVLGVAQAQVARLREGRQGLGDAGDGALVGGYVEVGYGMPDELVGGELVSFVMCIAKGTRAGDLRLRGLLLGAFLESVVVVMGILCVDSFWSR
jgi:hypothetical protein